MKTSKNSSSLLLRSSWFKHFGAKYIYKLSDAQSTILMNTSELFSSRSSAIEAIFWILLSDNLSSGYLIFKASSNPSNEKGSKYNTEKVSSTFIRLAVKHKGFF